MAEDLAVTFMDVGWGDSILVESEDRHGQHYYGLIDSNDTIHQPASLLFLKRFFERRGIMFQRPAPRVFQFILLTHTHADHAGGIYRILRQFGAEYFLYSSSSSSQDPLLAQIIRYAQRPGSRLGAIRPVDFGTSLRDIPFGRVELDILWPDRNFSHSDENNHSVVLSLTLNRVSFVLTGDATAEIWPRIVPRLPVQTKVFQVPHHGARNGMFDSTGATPWMSHYVTHVAPKHFALSCHARPHSHPHLDVANELTNKVMPPVGRSAVRRTDLDYHLTFKTDGSRVRSSYTHH